MIWDSLICANSLVKLRPAQCRWLKMEMSDAEESAIEEEDDQDQEEVMLHPSMCVSDYA